MYTDVQADILSEQGIKPPKPKVSTVIEQAEEEPAKPKRKSKAKA